MRSSRRALSRVVQILVQRARWPFTDHQKSLLQDYKPVPRGQFKTQFASVPHTRQFFCRRPYGLVQLSHGDNARLSRCFCTGACTCRLTVSGRLTVQIGQSRLSASCCNSHSRLPLVRNRGWWCRRGLWHCWLWVEPSSGFAHHRLTMRKHPNALPRSQRSVASRGESASDAHHLPPTPQFNGNQRGGTNACQLDRSSTTANLTDLSGPVKLWLESPHQKTQNFPQPHAF
jgi:hypothetical protein